MRKLAGVIPFFAVAACTPRVAVVTDGPVPPASADSIVLERTRCFGLCPTYTLSLTAAGHVSFTSTNPDDDRGEIRDTIPAERFARLSAEFDALPFSSLPGEVRKDHHYCGTPRTDAPGAIVTIYKASGMKSVNDYHGCEPAFGSNGARLSRLRKLEDRIDSVANAARWIKRRSRL